MKNLFVGLACCFVSVGVFAKEAQNIDFCDFLSEYAKVIMEGRQTGQDIKNPIRNLNEHFKSKESEKIKAAMESVVLTAYGNPIYENEIDKRRIATEFSNHTYVSCRGQ